MVSKPLAGVRIVEIAMWAFVPSAGGLLADLGAEVIKLEPPEGDPIRGLTTGGHAPGDGGFTLSWENYNRGKRSITLDLKVEGALAVLDRLLTSADVLLTSLLPPARRRLGIDADTLRARHPHLIYAVGSGTGARGPDAEKGGYDAITFWGRGGVASAVTPAGLDYPVAMPSGAYGDTTSGLALAGAVCAALYRRKATGEASLVDVSLLASSMWTMQRTITETILSGVDELPKRGRSAMPNPLVNSYRTADDRFVALCMLQGQRYWPGFCRAIGRPDLVDDPRFATDAKRAENLGECISIIDDVFATRTLAAWKTALAGQDGQWDVIQKPGELTSDPQVVANDYVQPVDYGSGRVFRMVSNPMQFDGAACRAAPAPDIGVDNDAILAGLGYSDDEIINLKVAGVIY